MTKIRTIEVPKEIMDRTLAEVLADPMPFPKMDMSMCKFPQDKLDKANLEAIAFEVNERGGTAFLVGGAVRDELLGKTVKDFDVEIHKLSEEQIVEILQKVSRLSDVKLNEVGKSFRVWKLGQNIDISLPRRDRKIGEGHKGFEVTADPTMSVEEAASRRDFTINAIMKNLHTGEIVDPFEGERDLLFNIIRMVNKNAFTEDPLRVLRGIQFAGRFGMLIATDTALAMLDVDLSELPGERIFMEVEKLLLKSEKPSRGLEWAVLAKHVFPELLALRGVQQDPVWHPEGDVFVHTMMVVDEAAKLVKDLPHEEALTVMLAALAHDFGKAPVTELIEGRWKAHAHDKAGVPLAEAFLDRLNVHSVNGFDVRGQVLALVEHHLAPPQLFREQEKGRLNKGRSFRRLALKVRLDLLALVSLADMLGRGVIPNEKEKSKHIFEWFLESAKNCDVEKTSEIEPILKGRDLIAMGMKPGKEMGELLKKAFELQLDGQLTSLGEAKAWVQLGIVRNDFDDFAAPSLMLVDL